MLNTYSFNFAIILKRSIYYFYKPCDSFTYQPFTKCKSKSILSESIGASRKYQITIITDNKKSDEILYNHIGYKVKATNFINYD